MRHYDQADFESEPDKYRLFTTARVVEKIESIPDLPVGAKVRIRFWDNRKNGPRGNAVMPIYELFPYPDNDDRWLVNACALGDFGDMVSYQDLAAMRDKAWSVDFIGADPLSPDEGALARHGLMWALLGAAETYRAIADGCGAGVTEADRAHADAVMDRARAAFEGAGASLDRASVPREGLVDLPDIEGAPAGGVRAIVPEF